VEIFLTKNKMTISEQFEFERKLQEILQKSLPDKKIFVRFPTDFLFVIDERIKITIDDKIFRYSLSLIDDLEKMNVNALEEMAINLIYSYLDITGNKDTKGQTPFMRDIEDSVKNGISLVHKSFEESQMFLPVYEKKNLNGTLIQQG